MRNVIFAFDHKRFDAIIEVSNIFTKLTRSLKPLAYQELWDNAFRLSFSRDKLITEYFDKVIKRNAVLFHSGFSTDENAAKN